MICLSIAQESRTLALADMLNAALMGADLLEVRLDSFDKSPNLTDLISAKRKPLLFSCRRLEDGGNWKGTEEERQMLLRQAILSKADYVELEHDIADQVRPFPPCQRVISYTNLKETPSDIADIYSTMQTKKPDVIKLTCRARTPEEAWPLVQILAKPPVPTVVVGLGRPGVMLAVLGKKIGAPWTFAALERGSEAYPGQPTMRDLQEIYAYNDIGKPTRFFGVTGLGDRAFLTTALLNYAFQKLKLHHRVLPMQVGNLKLFRKVADAVKLQGVNVDEEFFEKLHEAAKFDESSRAPVQAADMMQPAEEGWVASNLLGESAAEALTATILEREPAAGENPLKDRSVLFAGCGPLTRMLAGKMKERGAQLLFASKERSDAQRMSQIFGGRQLPWEAIYQTMHDVLIISRDGPKPDEEDEELPVHPGYLRNTMYVLDITSVGVESKFLREARSRRCGVVHPGRMLLEQVRAHVQRVSGQTIDANVLVEKMHELMPSDEEN